MDEKIKTLLDAFENWVLALNDEGCDDGCCKDDPSKYREQIEDILKQLLEN